MSPLASRRDAARLALRPDGRAVCPSATASWA